jgi:hypothetical protein
VASAKKPEAWVTSDETDWKRYGFDGILNQCVDEENLKLRKKLGHYEAHLADREKINERLKSELDLATQYIGTLKTAHSVATSQVGFRDAENRILREKLRQLYGKHDSLRTLLRVHGKLPSTDMKGEDAEESMHLDSRPEAEQCLGEAAQNFPGPPDSIAPSVSVGRLLAYDEGSDEKLQTSGISLFFRYLTTQLKSR